MSSKAKQITNISPALLVALALSLSGCGKPDPGPAASLKTGPAQVPWNWASFPPTSSMRLATTPCQLLPKSMITIFSPMLGTLHVNIQSPQTNLTAGLVWAEFEPEIFDAEQKAIEEARVRLEDREKLQTELEIPRQKLQLERQIEETQRQVALLRLLSTNQDLAAIAFNIGSNSESPLRPDSLSKAETELSLLSQTMSYLQATNLSILGIDLQGQRSEWQRRKLEFDHRRSQATLRMPFQGRLTTTLPLTEGVTEYPVNTGQELAVARDISSIQLRVPLANFGWSSLPPDKLTAVIRLPSGQELSAAFNYQKIERIQNREESVYYFLFPKEKSEIAAKLLGTDLSCEVWYALPQPIRVVPKLSLVMQIPSAFQGRNWAQGVALAWPNAELAAEGQTDLGIILGPDKK